jgi:hypothetical protein
MIRLPPHAALCALSTAVAGFGWTLIATPATATDGIGEINQVCAVNTGCLSGDSAGFPVTISASGSYRLTGNLDLSSEASSTHAIEVIPPAVGVTLDLGGFEIVGGCATGGPCSGSGSGIRLATTVRNGTVRNMPFRGLDLGGAAIVEGVRALNNGGEGIVAFGNTIVSNSTANSNLNDGIVVFGQGNVQDCTASYNATSGIVFFGEGHGLIESNVANANNTNGIRISPTRLGVVLRGNSTNQNTESGIEAPGTGMSIVDNSASGNGIYGINVGDGNLVHSNSASLNDAGGIFSLLGNTVTGNTTWGNGTGTGGGVADGIFANSGSNVSNNTSQSNTGHGISVNGASRVFGNTSINNVRRGLRMQSNVAYGQNVTAGNGEGNIDSGLEMGENFCETNLTCP